MIQVKVIKSSDEQRILQVTIHGHANFGKLGQDIVCSAVSALALGAVNSVEILLGIDLKPEENPKQAGYLFWNVPQMDDPITDDRLQLLMKALVESLLMIEKEYGRYIRVNIQTS
ncbi:MAG: ribosomal-processing cysteine protease Prp [Tepidibacillus sp.]